MDFFSGLYFVIILLFSAIIHEYMHGWMADTLGDPTARYAGRLTLNPKSHIDVFGSIILPLLTLQAGFMFAYAKPVPYNPYNLKDAKWDPVWVALAGPGSNLILAFVFGVLIQLGTFSSLLPFLVPIVQVNVLLAVFNMLPIPPLDGSKLLFALLPRELDHIKVQLERYGYILLFAFVLLGFSVISPIISSLTMFFVSWMG